ncbi:MAG: hypothetical protein WCG10_07540 [Chlamydiota bacterium]
MTLSINNLPKKFYPYLLGHAECNATYKNQIDAVFQQPLRPLAQNPQEGQFAVRPYIFDAGNWFLKLNRTDQPNIRPDTVLYRIRKAAKIEKFIIENHLENQFILPKKNLYWHPQEQRFYVVSEKLQLSNEVAEPLNAQIEQEFKYNADQAHGQAEALANGAPKRSITADQAKNLARMCLELGYTDLSYNNLYFNQEGKVAIIDTEPVQRTFKKTIFSFWVFRCGLADRVWVCAEHALGGISRLKFYCSNPLAMKAVEKIERNHILWNLAKLASKLGVTCLMIYVAPSLVSRVVVLGVVKGVLYIKVSLLAMNSLSLLRCLYLTHRGLLGWSKIIQQHPI